MKSAADCPARIKQNIETGQFWMRKDHNHERIEKCYEDFLMSAIKVRKFAKKLKIKKEPEEKKVTTGFEGCEDMGNFALEMSRLKFEGIIRAAEEAEEEPDESLLVEILSE